MTLLLLTLFKMEPTILSPYQEEFDGTALVLFLQYDPLSDIYHQIMLTDEQIRKLYKILPNIIGTSHSNGGFDLQVSETKTIEFPGIKDRYTPEEIENDSI
jgi:hypothetical protein